MSLAVVCPTRGRPDSFARMARSVLSTSDAFTLGYTDLDDRPSHGLTSIVLQQPSVVVCAGQSVGRSGAINHLCLSHPKHRAYLLVSDDIEFIRPGWDKDILSAMDSFGDDIGVVHLKDGMQNGNVSWPCVSRKWIDAVGWFNPPRLRHYCQDTAIQAMGEALGRIKAIDEIALRHDCMSSDNGNYQKDVQEFLDFMAHDFGPALNRIREVMR